MLSFGSVSCEIFNTSGSRGNRGREPTPLTPDILCLLDRLEPSTGKYARLLTDHLTRQRLLPSTEHELDAHMEKNALRELQKQQAAAEATATREANHVELNKTNLENVMAAHMTAPAQSEALAARATKGGGQHYGRNSHGRGHDGQTPSTHACVTHHTNAKKQTVKDMRLKHISTS